MVLYVIWPYIRMGAYILGVGGGVGAYIRNDLFVNKWMSLYPGGLTHDFMVRAKVASVKTWNI